MLDAIWGIDSPVAGYLAMKRGMEIQCVHFASPPHTSPISTRENKPLAAKIAGLRKYSILNGTFSRIQEEIKKSVPEGI